VVFDLKKKGDDKLLTQERDICRFAEEEFNGAGIIRFCRVSVDGAIFLLAIKVAPSIDILPANLDISRSWFNNL
jgi:hypothetical protein